MASETSAAPSLDASVTLMASEISAAPSLDASVPEITSEISAAPNLDASVPRIVITGPSTLNRVPSITSLSDKSRAASPPHLESQTEQAVNVPLASEQSSELSDSTGEFIPAPDCNQCIVPVPESTDESRVVIQDEERSNPDTDIGDIRRDSRCCRECRRCFRFHDALWEFMDTTYAIPIWILMMALPISAGFMGARYLNECIFSPPTAPMMFLMGICGVILITTRVVLILHKATWEQTVGPTGLHIVLMLTCILTLIVFCTEMMAFWRYTPSFDKSSPNYCNQTFYTYTFWMNCVTLSLLVLMLLIRMPICTLCR